MHRKQLIKKFLRNECSAQEAEQAIRYLEEDPSLLNEMLGKQEWDEVPIARPMNPDVEETMRRAVKAETTATPVRRMMAMAAAACIAGMMLLGYFLRFNNHEMPQFAVAAVEQQELANLTSTVQKHTLPDGSVIDLYPGSRIHFEKELKSNRHIYLQGKADFDVVKNKQKPFVVYASDITTTALGTSFRVSEIEGKTIEVQLFEGKVAVKSIAPGVSIEDIYLTPGHQCRIDLSTSAVSVTLISGLKPSLPSLPATQKTTPEVIENEKDMATLDFVKAPVDKVFRQLERMYEVEIEYDGNEIDGAYFTGAFKPGSSLSAVLDIVCSMNGLSWQSINNVIRVEKNITGDETDGQVTEQSGRSASIQHATNYSSVLKPKSQNIEVPGVTTLARMKPLTYYVREDGAVMFNKASLTDALKILQRTRSSNINFFENEIEQVYVTGVVDNNASLEQFLTAVCAMNGLRLDIENEQFVIRRN